MKVFIGLVVLIIIIGGGLALFRYNDNPTPTVINPPTAPVVPQPTTPAPSATGTSTGTATPPTGVNVSATTSVQVGQRIVDVTVNGSNFAFSPKQIQVKKGDTVRLTFKNEGGLHDLIIDEFNARTNKINGGESQTIQFVADKVGSFEYYCSVGTHRQMGMVGTSVVTQ